MCARRKERQEKHEKVIVFKGKSTADIQTKLQSKHKKQPKYTQKLRQDLCNRCDWEVEAESGVGATLAK